MVFLANCHQRISKDFAIDGEAIELLRRHDEDQTVDEIVALAQCSFVEVFEKFTDEDNENLIYFTI